MLLRFLKKALIFSAFFCGSVFYHVAQAGNDDCELPKQGWAQDNIKHIADGDTVTLTDGTHLRFIGINTPEIDHKALHNSDPFAVEAKDYLAKLIKKSNGSVKWLAGAERTDKYKRHLAHPFTADGINITAALLEQGLGYWIHFPPNTAYSTCYRRAEQMARQHQQGIWSGAGPVKRQKSLGKQTGFVLYQGQLTRYKLHQKGIWIELDDGRLSLTGNASVAQHFDKKMLGRLKGKGVEVRGWIYKNRVYKNKGLQARMSLKSPEQIQAL